MIYKVTTFRGYKVTTDFYESEKIAKRLLNELAREAARGKVDPVNLWVRTDKYAAATSQEPFINYLGSTFIGPRYEQLHG